MKRKLLVVAILFSFSCLKVLAEIESDGDPEWTKKIPKDRYPCICDTPMPQGQRNLDQPEEAFLARTEKALNDSFKEQLDGFPFRDPKQLKFELGYAVTRNNQFLFFLERRSSESGFFNACVYRAISLTCNSSAPTFEESHRPAVQLHFTFTPDGVYHPKTLVIESQKTSGLHSPEAPIGGGAKSAVSTDNNHVTEVSVPSADDSKVWDKWHKKLAEELFIRINKRVEPAVKHHAKLHCIITWRVWRNGEIEILQLEGTENQSFREIIAQEMKSLAGSPLLVFPKGFENRYFVEKRSDYSFGIFKTRFGDFDSTINRKLPFVDGKKVPEKIKHDEKIGSQKKLHDFVNGKSKHLDGYDSF